MDDPSAQQWRAGVDRYREVATWVIGAFAAIGVLLAGTAPLTGIGQVSAGRLPALLWGSVLGLLGVGLAITATALSLVPRTVYSHEIRPKTQRLPRRLFSGLGPLESILKKHPESVLPPGIDSWNDLLEGIKNLQEHADTTDRESRDPDKTEEQREIASNAHTRYVALLVEYETARHEVLLMARFEKARTGFRLAFLAMLLGASLAGIGLGLVLWGVADEDKGAAELRKLAAETRKINAETRKTNAEAADLLREADADEEGEDASATSLPVVSLALTSQGKEELGTLLGPECNLDAVLPAVLLQGDGATGVWEVLTAPGPCNSVRLTLTAALGSFENTP